MPQFAEELRQLNASLSARVTALDVLNETNAQLNRMNAFFQTAESSTELYEALSRFGEVIFPGKLGAFFKLENGAYFELATSWGGDYEGGEYFHINDCWGLRQGEIKIQEPGDKRLKCHHLNDVGVQYALCQPVSTREGIVGMISIYAENTDSEKAGQELNLAMDQCKDAIIAVSDRLGIAISNLQLREKLKQESIRDSLTKLFNRRFLDEALEMEFRKIKRNATPISLVLIDADEFKGFNDSYGHDVGDIVLQKIAEVLKKSARAEDLPCRYGGEEFALAFIGMDLDSATKRTEQIRKAVEAIEVHYNGELLPKITVSCGVASFPENANSHHACIKEADKALYRAKAEGRNRVVAANPGDIAP